jgi:hypothetical protein
MAESRLYELLEFLSLAKALRSLLGYRAADANRVNGPVDVLVYSPNIRLLKLQTELMM